MDVTIVAALIAAATAIGTTFLAHHLSQRKSAEQEQRNLHPLSIADAQRRIADKASRLGMTGLSAVRYATTSPFGTAAFVSDAADDKGAIYCHATGAKRGAVYYVRKGIGWYYKHEMGGPSSFLGLPLSDEEDMPRGERRSLFEGGYILWSSNDDSLSVYDTSAGGEGKVISRYQF